MIDDIKIQLRNVRFEQMEIEMLIEQSMRIKSQLESVTSQLRDVCVQTGVESPDTFADRVDALISLNKAIAERVEVLTERQEKLFKLVAELENPQHRAVLEKYYLFTEHVGITWEEVAEQMGYTKRQILRIHGNALREIRKIIEN